MGRKYFIFMFMLCFFVWVIVVDHALIPSMNHLRQDVGQFSRYRVKEGLQDRQLNLMKDELLIYAYVNNREQLYYIEHNPYFEMALKHMTKGDPVQLRYQRAFPKFWKRTLYDLRQDGASRFRYLPSQLKEKQVFIWKFSGIMAGIYLGVVGVGLIAKRRTI